MLIRKLIEEALKAIENDETPIVIAPTGYGKTIATPYIHKYVKERNLARGVIHVSPLRALVEKVFVDIFRCNGGIQAYGVRGERKSPYLLRSPLAVTLDSFILSLYRFPVLEKIKIEEGTSAGHYYPVLSAIKSSLIIFDEVHLALESNEKSGYEALMAGVSALARMGTRFVIETATMRPNVIGKLVNEMRGNKVKILLLGDEDCDYVKKLRGEAGNNAEIIAMKDDDFVNAQSIKWSTRIDREIDYDEIAKLAGEKLVLVVLNTVPRAQEVYRELKRRGVNNLVLIHGKLATRDREEALNRIGGSSESCDDVEKGGGMEKGVIISTQVIEAGVDVNASIVYTEASPLESLIQRIGRACRRGGVLEECKKGEGGEVIIVNDGNYGPYDDKLVLSDLSLISEDIDIDWRIPYGRRNYTDLLARARSRTLEGDRPLQNVYESYLTSDAPPNELLEILKEKRMCSVYGDLAPILLYVEEVGLINVSLSDISSGNSWVWKVVEYGENNRPIIVIIDEDGNEVDRGEASRLKRGDYDCIVIKKIIEDEMEKMLSQSAYNRRYSIALKVKNYERGVGPIVQT